MRSKTATTACVAVAISALLAAAVADAGDLALMPELSQGQFEELVDHLAEGVDMPGAPAHPLGPTGFDLRVGAFWIQGDDNASWWENSVSGTSDALGGTVGYRASLRKGLPRGIDLGFQVGSVLGEDFWSAEVRGPLYRGGLGRPSVGVRAVWSQLAAGAVDLEVFTAQVGASKSFKLLTPYATAGMRWVSADASQAWDETPLGLEADSTTFSASAGVQVDLRPLGLLLELRHASSIALFLGTGFGF